MSMFDFATAVCGRCGGEAEVEFVLSVNADRRPDLRDQILDGTFQAVPCPSCGVQVRIAPRFVYLDAGRGQWIAVYPADELARWPEIERESAEAFEAGFGAGAPPFVRELAAGMEASVVFGWPAIRERLLARDLGLAAAPLELLKMAIMAQGMFEWDVAQEMRLTFGDAAALRFDLIESATEATMAGFELAREHYDTIMAEPDAWALLRTRIAGGMFIDVRRAMVAIDAEAMGQEPAA
jgi:hypothetical protein